MKRIALAAASSLIASGTPAIAQTVQPTMLSMTQSYERSKLATLDAYVTGRLITAYTLTEQLDSADIHVYVHDRSVILTGIVENAIQEELALEIARGVPGLEAVQSDLVVKPEENTIHAAASDAGFTQHFRNAAMKARIKTRLMWNKHISGLAIDVIAKQGDITLLGAVISAEQAALAEAIAENTQGVNSVDNQIRIKAVSKS